MGIKFYCPQGHKLHVKAFLGGKRGICPHCGVKVRIPAENQGSIDPGQVDFELEAVTMAAFAEYQVTNTGESKEGSLAAGPPRAEDIPASGATASHEGSTDSNLRVPLETADEMPENQDASTAVPQLDALDEAPHTEWYVRPSAGGQFGPASSNVMRSWLSQGRIGPDSTVWREGWDDWIRARDVFFPLLPAPATAEPPATPEEEIRIEIVKSNAATVAGAKMPSGADIGHVRKRQRRKTELSLLIVIMLGLGILVLIPVLIYVVSNR